MRYYGPSSLNRISDERTFKEVLAFGQKYLSGALKGTKVTSYSANVQAYSLQESKSNRRKEMWNNRTIDNLYLVLKHYLIFI